MRPPLIRQGAGPNALTQLYHDHLEHRRQLNRMIATANATPDEQDNRRRGIIAARSPAGDELRLRMIPAVARGVAGAIPGTNPGQAITRCAA